MISQISRSCIRVYLYYLSFFNFIGFGAPVPRTTAGRTVGVIFAVVGIPAHFLLVLNFGLMIAVRLQRYANARRMQSQQCDEETSYSTPMPRWVKIIPFIFSGKLSTVYILTKIYLPSFHNFNFQFISKNWLIEIKRTINLLK